MKFALLVFISCSTSIFAFVSTPAIVHSVPVPRHVPAVVWQPTIQPRSSLGEYFALHQTDGSDEGESSGQKSGIEDELETLQEQLSLIEALEERNKSQLESFVDEEDQWNSMDDYEKELLNSKEKVVERMDLLAEQMIMLWMGQKSQDG